ncbi:unnamed protein product [Arabidopsis arenosa]|uniref:Dolichyl-diphosphooligosaccharide--protein glycosyltransferase subunit 2 n=1 Tax=Arabidopsis arenosa TaxID=38785 RepID=A0A8S2B4R6_ARAAE|nr:unnamed protein product [Arabidopsis arenosa]
MVLRFSSSFALSSPHSPLTTDTRRLHLPSMMVGGLLRFLVSLLAVAICNAASISQPISESHRSAALDFALCKSDLSSATCENVVKVLASPSSALRVNGILKCNLEKMFLRTLSVSKLQARAKDAKLLLDFYYSVRGLVLVKEQFSGTDLSLADAEAIFPSIKALSQSDGRWRYSSNNPESSTFGAGLAFETLAGVISLAPSGIDQSMVREIFDPDTETGILKLFDRIQKYDDGTFYFDDSEGPISTTASVIRGLTSFSASESTGLNLPGDKIVGLAKFFLGVGIPGDAKDFFNQIDALACLEDNRQCYFLALFMQFLFVLFQFSVPLILSLPSTVISLTKKELLKVKVSTVLGSKAPALSVKVAEALNSKGSKFDADSATYFLDSFPKNLDVGKYTFVFEILLDESANEKAYVTEAQTKVPIAATGAISIENAENCYLTKDEAVSLSANHLQKLRLSFQLTTPLGLVFKPHQAFLKLKHESQDFLGLVEKLYYLSGKYEIQLTIGDADTVGSEHKELPIIDWSCKHPLYYSTAASELFCFSTCYSVGSVHDTKGTFFVGVFLLFVGHSTLSHLAAASNKLKSA